jgi:hypothetical protein
MQTSLLDWGVRGFVLVPHGLQRGQDHASRMQAIQRSEDPQGPAYRRNVDNPPANRSCHGQERIWKASINACAVLYPNDICCSDCCGEEERDGCGSGWVVFGFESEEVWDVDQRGEEERDWRRDIE